MTISNQWFEGHGKALNETREQVKRYDKKGFVWLIELRVLLVLLVLEK